MAWVMVAAAAIQPVAVGASDDGDRPPLHFPSPSVGYHSASQLASLVSGWVAMDERVERLDLGESLDGLAIPAFAFSSAGERAGQRTVVLLGGMDGVSQAGSEGVLWSAHALLTQLDLLPKDLRFVVIPWASPDALDRTHRGLLRGGRSSTPFDDDRDGRFAEDGPEDIDGDGQVLNMVVPDPLHGEWCFSEDHRFLVPAGPGDSPRYSLVAEGRDDDGDGLFNEDSVGGVNYNAHFPLGWDENSRCDGRGAWPLADEVPRRLAEYLAPMDIALCLSFVGSHGGLSFARPARAARVHGAKAPATEETERRIRLAFDRMTGRESDLSDQPNFAAGRAVDWIGSTFSCVALEVAVWGPNVVGADGRPFRAWPTGSTDAGPQIDRSGDAMDAGRPLSPEARAWAFWLAEVKGGMGFQDWHPVDLGKGLTGWVGGFEPRTRFNPPAGVLHNAIEGVPRFVQEVVAGLPRIDLELLSAERIGDLVHVEARAVNHGGLATDYCRGRDGGKVVVAIEGVSETAVVAGAAVRELQRLGPGESSGRLRWIVQVKPGASFTIAGRSEAAGSATREVRL